MGNLYCCRQGLFEKDITLDINNLNSKDCANTSQLAMDTVLSNSIDGDKYDSMAGNRAISSYYIPELAKKDNIEIPLEIQSVRTQPLDSNRENLSSKEDTSRLKSVKDRRISVEHATPLILKDRVDNHDNINLGINISKSTSLSDDIIIQEPKMNKKKKKPVKKINSPKKDTYKHDTNSPRHSNSVSEEIISRRDSKNSNFTSESEKSGEKSGEYAGDTSPKNKHLDKTPNKTNYFDLLNLNPQRKEQELEIAKKRINEVEKIYFKVELNNLNDKLHREQIFQVEVLFTNSDNIHDFFTIGNTHRYRPSDDLSVRFPEEFEINYLFERVQFLRFVIYSSDNTTSEVSINLVQVIRQKFNDCTMPIDLINGECILYTENKVDKSKQEVSISFYQKNQNYDDKTTPCILLDFQFNTPEQVSKKLYYEVLTEDEIAQKKFIYKSNEVMGLGPFEFTVVHVDKNNVFLDPKIAIYCFEFYEDENYLGQILIDKLEMDEIIDSISSVPYIVSNEGNQFNVFKKSSSKTQHSNRNLQNYDPSSPILKKKGSNLFLKKKSTKIKPNNAVPSLSRLSKLKEDKKDEKKEERKDEEENENEDSFEVKKFSTYQTMTEDYFKVGKADILYKDIKKSRFIDYILNDLQMIFPIAIDFTLSNFNPNHPKSLHPFDLKQNKYIKTIKSFAKIVKDYTLNKKFPVYGFGANLKDSKEPSHCFKLNMNNDTYIDSIEDIISNYSKRLKNIQFSNPTYLHYVLREVISLIKNVKSESKVINYCTLLILIDGAFDDLNEVKNLIVEASKLPISIIIVGIGNANFDKLEIFNDKEKPIVAPSNGEKIYREMVQFLRHVKFDTEDMLAEKALHKLPIQLMEYCKMKGL